MSMWNLFLFNVMLQRHQIKWNNMFAALALIVVVPITKLYTMLQRQCIHWVNVDGVFKTLQKTTISKPPPPLKIPCRQHHGNWSLSNGRNLNLHDINRISGNKGTRAQLLDFQCHLASGKCSVHSVEKLRVLSCP